MRLSPTTQILVPLVLSLCFVFLLVLNREQMEEAPKQESTKLSEDINTVPKKVTKEGSAEHEELHIARIRAIKNLSENIRTKISASSRYSQILDGDYSEYFEEYIESQSGADLQGINIEWVETDKGYLVTATMDVHGSMAMYKSSLRIMNDDIHSRRNADIGANDLERYKLHKSLKRQIEEYHAIFHFASLLNAYLNKGTEFEEEFRPKNFPNTSTLEIDIKNVEAENAPFRDLDWIIAILDVENVSVERICPVLPYHLKVTQDAVFGAFERSLGDVSSNAKFQRAIPRLRQNEKSQFVLELRVNSHHSSQLKVFSSVVISDELLVDYQYPNISKAKSIIVSEQILKDENNRVFPTENFISAMIKNDYPSVNPNIKQWQDADPCKPLADLTNKEKIQLYGAEHLIEVTLHGKIGFRNAAVYGDVPGRSVTANLWLKEFDLSNDNMIADFQDSGAHPNVSEETAQFVTASERALKKVVDEREQFVEGPEQ